MVKCGASGTKNKGQPMKTEPISATLADWSREHKAWSEWAPSRSLLASIRAYQKHAASRAMLAPIFKKIAVLRHRFWSVVTGADVPLNVNIGGGLLMPHPNGIVIHPDAIIGPNCLIFQQVTIGNRYAGSGCPRIGGHVDIGAGAKLLGDVQVGDHAKIAANAVVLINVADHQVAAGVPAKILK